MDGIRVYYDSVNLALRASRRDNAVMPHQFNTSHIKDSIELFRYYKKLAERAIEQCPDAGLPTMMVFGWMTFTTLAIGYFTFLIWALVVDMDILTQSNSRLAPDEQFPLVGNTKAWELRQQYQALFRH